MASGEVISLLSAFVALLAAVYAGWEARAARRANEISLHNERLKVYRTTLHFGASLAGKGPRISEDDVWRFREAADLSEFYYNDSIFKRLNQVFTDSLKLLTRNDEWQEAQRANTPETKALNAERYKLAQAIRDECFSVAEEMKGKLRVGRA